VNPSISLASLYHRCQRKGPVGGLMPLLMQSGCKDKAIFLKNKNIPDFSWKKFVDSGKVTIFASDNYMLNS
jgi:hypothetical protein